MKTKLLALLALVFSGVAYADAPKVIIISPTDLVEAWQEEYAAKVPAITGGDYEVVSTETIYETHPYAAENTDGKPRNPAESIHKFIESKASDVQYFILGGPWVDAQDMTSKTIKLATGETLGLNNTVPGIIACNGSKYGSCESDLYYACLDSGNTYAWDVDGDGEYLEADSIKDEDGNPRHSTIPDVSVTRIPLVTWSEWKKADNTLYSQRELLAAYVAKLEKGLSPTFDGINSIASYGYTVYETDNNIYPKLGGAYNDLVRRDESEFYTGVKNMFDPARGTDSFWCAEPISRRHMKEQVACSRPISSMTALWEETWSSDYATRDDAREALYKNNHALKFYYCHSNWGGGHGFSRDDFKSEGCGLTLVDDCAGPCSTGSIVLQRQADGTYLYDVNYAISSVMSPYGGSLATVNNTRAGFFSSDFRGRFDSGCSFELESHLLEEFVCTNRTVGAAWSEMVKRYAKNRQTDSTHVWIYSEVMLQGDPLVKLPAIENGLAYADGITYTGLADKTDVVVSMQIAGDKVINTPTVPLKVMNGLTTSGSSLTICTGEGGIGGEGVVFTGAKGELTLAGDEPFYVAGVKNANRVTFSGKGCVLELDETEIAGDQNQALYFSQGSDATIRSKTEGVFSKLKDRQLDLCRKGTIRLATWNAFGSVKGVINQTLSGAQKLVIEANPYYHDGNDRGESLNATIKLGASTTLDIIVAKGGYFTPVEALMGDNRVTYEVDARDGLGGNVTVPNKAKLTLKELPLSKIETLTVESGATLVIPEGKTLDDLLSSGTATLKSGAKIACGAETTTLSEDKRVDGSKYVTKYYYTSDTTAWTDGVKMSLEPNGVADTLPTADGEVVFAKGATFPAAEGANLYVHDNVLCKSIHVTDSTTLKLGAESGQKWNLRSGFKVTVDEGSTLILRGWGNGGQKETNPAKVADGVVFDGDGVVTIDVKDAPVCSWGNVSGTATISLPVGVTINCSGTISNDIVVPEGYKLKTITEGTTTTYVAEEDVEPPTEIIRQWSDTTGISHDSASPTVLFTGITLDDLMSDRYTLVGAIGGAWINGGNSNISADKAVFGEKSGNEVNVQLQAKDSDSSFTGVKFVNLKLIEDGPTIKAYQYGQGNKRSNTYEGYGVFITSSDVVVADTGYILKSAVAWRRYVIEDEQTWDALPSDFHTGDTIEVTKDGELTLTFAMPQPVIGSGRVITTVSPSTELKDSLTKDSWTGTFVLKGLTANQSGDDLWNFDPTNYGNTGSQVELWNCKGFTAGNVVIERPIIITGEFCFSDGYDGKKNTLSCLKGTGTITSTYNKMTYTVLDASEFYGTVANESVVILPATSPSVLKKNGYLSYTIGVDGTVSEVEPTEKAQPTIGALTLGEAATVTIAAPIEGLTYALKSAATLDAEAWDSDASTKAKSSEPLTLEAKPSTSPARFFKVEVSF